MIEYDYTIERDEGIKTRTFRPKLPTKLDNISYIEGLNSYGKSTLLNILALAFYGDRKALHPALVHKMNKLLKSSHQQLVFKVTISSNDGSLQIVSEKKDPNKPEITVREVVDGKSMLLSHQSFEKKYNLIYDIPANPTERLKELGNEIKDEQVKYSRHLTPLREFIRSTISDIQNSRDPEKIKKLKNDLEGFKKSVEKIKQEITNLTTEHNLLEKAVYYKYYHSYKAICSQKKEKIEEIEKSWNRAEKQKNKSVLQSSNLRSKLQNELSELNKIFVKIIEVLQVLFRQGQEHHFRILERLDVFETAKSLEFDKIKYEIEFFKKLLEELESKKDSEIAVQEVRLYRELIHVLERYQSSDLSIPGVKKTISEFIEDLKESYKKKTGITAILDNIENIKVLFAELESKMHEIEETILNKLKELKEAEESGVENLDEKKLRELDHLKEDLKKAVKQFEFYDLRYAALGRPHHSEICQIGTRQLNDYEGYTEEQLIRRIEDFKSEIKTNKEELDRKNRHIKFHEDEIAKLEKKEPHIYQNYIEELKKLMGVVAVLESKISVDFHDYIENIIKKRDTKPTKEQERYNQAVFKYLGNKIGFIRHLNDEYEVELIDLVEEKIVTKEGRFIYLVDMGTGQSQSAYLKGKLEISDDRRIIAFFDEVAMMDQKSLEPIYDKFRDLYRKDRLLAGLVVQKAETPKVISKVK